MLDDMHATKRNESQYIHLYSDYILSYELELYFPCISQQKAYYEDIK